MSASLLESIKGMAAPQVNVDGLLKSLDELTAKTNKAVKDAVERTAPAREQMSEKYDTGERAVKQAVAQIEARIEEVKPKIMGAIADIQANPTDLEKINERLVKLADDLGIKRPEFLKNAPTPEELGKKIAGMVRDAGKAYEDKIEPAIIEALTHAQENYLRVKPDIEAAAVKMTADSANLDTVNQDLKDLAGKLGVKIPEFFKEMPTPKQVGEKLAKVTQDAGAVYDKNVEPMVKSALAAVHLETAYDEIKPKITKATSKILENAGDLSHVNAVLVDLRRELKIPGSEVFDKLPNPEQLAKEFSEITTKAVAAYEKNIDPTVQKVLANSLETYKHVKSKLVPAVTEIMQKPDDLQHANDVLVKLRRDLAIPGTEVFDKLPSPKQLTEELTKIASQGADVYKEKIQPLINDALANAGQTLDAVKADVTKAGAAIAADPSLSGVNKALVELRDKLNLPGTEMLKSLPTPESLSKEFTKITQQADQIYKEKVAPVIDTALAGAKASYEFAAPKITAAATAIMAKPTLENANTQIVKLADNLGIKRPEFLKNAPTPNQVIAQTGATLSNMGQQVEQSYKQNVAPVLNNVSEGVKGSIKQAAQVGSRLTGWLSAARLENWEKQ